MTLLATRRNFLAKTAGTAGAALFVHPFIASAALQHPQPLPSPNAPTNQNVPAGLNNYPWGDPSHPVANASNAADVKRMVEQLYELTLELKQETERTNFQTTLPIDFLKRAHEIEKLAKTVRERAKG